MNQEDKPRCAKHGHILIQIGDEMICLDCDYPDSIVLPKTNED